VEAVGYLSGPKGGDEQYIYTGGNRGIIRIWDIKSRKEISQSSSSYGEEKETGGILDIMYFPCRHLDLLQATTMRMILY
jgi:WD40 repeat protein